MNQVLNNFKFSINNSNNVLLKNTLIILKNTYVRQLQKSKYANKYTLMKSYSYKFCRLSVNSNVLDKIIHKIFTT